MDSSLRHLLVVCCHGGQPWVDFHQQEVSHVGTRTMDPTDWSAEDIPGSSLLNGTSSLPEVVSLLSRGISLDQCDLFNLTFSSSADQEVFDHYRAAVHCRCPLSFVGTSCEDPLALPLVSSSPLPTAPGSIMMVIILAVIALVLFAMAFLAIQMLRGCCCDCFGPWKRRDADLDKELDPEYVTRSLAKVRAYEERQRISSSGECRRPLVSTISDHCEVPYPPPPPPAIVVPIDRPRSPPPAYSPLPTQSEQLPPQRTTTTNV